MISFLSNPNDATYKLQFDWKEGHLVVSLIGESFLYQYKIVEKDKERFRPKTIVQFNSLLSPEEQSVKTEGMDGLLIRIFRETYDENGKRIENEPISEDFYAPIHQVEVHGLIVSEKESDTVSENSDTTDATDEQTNENPNDTNDQKTGTEAGFQTGQADSTNNATSPASEVEDAGKELE